MPVAIAVAGLVVAAAGATASVVQGNKAAANARHGADLQEQAQQEQKAQNAQQAAEQQRQAVRDQRVKQARVLQGASNTGTDSSSGELGAIGALATNFSTNQEQTLGAITRSNAISDLSQGAADANFESRQDSQKGQEFAQFGQVGGSIFGAAVKTPAGAQFVNNIFK